MKRITPGEIISHYRITEKLGEGGMGVVYKAHDTTLDLNVALKFLPHYLTTDPNEKEGFYHEAYVADALMYQNVAVIHEIINFEEQVFVSMEYVESGKPPITYSQGKNRHISELKKWSRQKQYLTLDIKRRISEKHKI